MNNNSTNQTENVSTQYSTAGNLNARIELHRKFSTNHYGWSQWVFDQLKLEGIKAVLELGCGSGDLWKSNLPRKPDDIQIILTDFSKGMLETAKQQLKDVSSAFEFQVVDAQSIPYEKQSFDAVIANHMLYHVPDRKSALSEMNRVLKDNGTLYATTIGAGHMKELSELVLGYDAEIDYPLNSAAENFGLENGAGQVKEIFRDIRVLRYEDSLVVTEADLLVDYVLSIKGFGNVAELIPQDRKKDFAEYVSAAIRKNGSIKITKDSGMLIASK